METVSDMTINELMGDYVPKELDMELCPKCASKIKIIKFDDDAWGNRRDFVEKNCTDANCGWWKIE